RTWGPSSTRWSTAWSPARCPTRVAWAASTETSLTATPGSRSRVSPSSSRQALVTGIGGQDGGYLAEQLMAEGYQVWGMVRGPEGLARARGCPWLSDVHLIEGDLSDAVSLQRVLEQSAPDEIYNLAAQSIPSRSWDEPEASAEVNALGPLRLLDAIRTAGGRGVRFCQASTS